MSSFSWCAAACGMIVLHVTSQILIVLYCSVTNTTPTRNSKGLTDKSPNDFIRIETWNFVQFDFSSLIEIILKSFDKDGKGKKRARAARWCAYYIQASLFMKLDLRLLVRLCCTNHARSQGRKPSLTHFIKI